MSTELIDLRTLKKGTLCESTGPLRTILGPLRTILGPLRTILGPVAALLGLPEHGVRFRVITPDDGTKHYPCGVQWPDAVPHLAWLEAMQPAKVIEPVTLDEVSP